jgi:hypothetical protein
MSYVAVDRDIWTSTVLKEGPVVVATWLLLMADADRYGVTRATPTSIASVLRIPDAEVEQAFDILLKPDPNSRNKASKGARMEALGDGSYFLTSYVKYKDRATKAAAARRQKEYEERKKLKDRATEQYNGPSPEETAAAFAEPVDAPVAIDPATGEEFGPNGQPWRNEP